MVTGFDKIFFQISADDHQHSEGGSGNYGNNVNIADKCFHEVQNA